MWNTTRRPYLIICSALNAELSHGYKADSDPHHFHVPASSGRPGVSALVLNANTQRRSLSEPGAARSTTTCFWNKLGVLQVRLVVNDHETETNIRWRCSVFKCQQTGRTSETFKRNVRTTIWHSLMKVEDETSFSNIYLHVLSDDDIKSIHTLTHLFIIVCYDHWIIDHFWTNFWMNLLRWV